MRTFVSIGVTAALIALGAVVPGQAGAAGAAKTPKVVKVCVTKKTGAMRQVKSAKACTRKERFLKWRTAPRNGSVAITIVCNVQAEASVGSTPAAQSVRRVRVPLPDGGTVTVAVTCANAVNAGA